MPVLSNDIRNWILNSKKYFYVYLFSNNPSWTRINSIAKPLDLEFTSSGSKPSRKKLNRVIQKIPYPPNEIAIIGDRIFTDILVGNRLGMYTILVDSVDYYGEKVEKNFFQSIERKFATIISGEFA
tara:strand:+ start:257 stop:634 length:378 start_codon:yes stop_codon:yes gene_type:complete